MTFLEILSNAVDLEPTLTIQPLIHAAIQLFTILILKLVATMMS